MSSATGGYGAEQHCHCHCHGEFLVQHSAQHVAGQLYHVPQHSRREKLRFPAPDAADNDSPPHAHHHHPGPWPTPPPPPPPAAFYSYASSSPSSYSPHSPALAAQAQLVPHGLAAQNLALSSDPPATTPRRQRPYGPFTGYAAVLGRSRFLAPAEKLLQEICDAGGAAARVDRSVSDEDLLYADPVEAVHHEMDGGNRTASDADLQQRKMRLISMMEEVS
jgi:hypothetical protein